MGVLTIHDGKGKKDRTVPLPVMIMPEINRQFEVVRTLHRQDLEEGTSGVFMFESIEKKYKNAGQESHWQLPRGQNLVFPCKRNDLGS